MTHSESTAKIAGALAKAQGAMKPAAKDSTNPHFGSHYADLASVWEACRTELAAQEVAVLQSPSTKGTVVGMVTMLLHSSGEWILSDPLEVQSRDAAPQAVGSCLTYLRRYQLAAMAGVTPDDDAEAGEGRGTVTTVKPTPAAQVEPVIDLKTGAQIPAGFALIDDVKQDGAFTQVFWGRDGAGGWRKFSTKVPHLAGAARKAFDERVPVRLMSKDGKYLDKVERLDAVEAA